MKCIALARWSVRCCASPKTTLAAPSYGYSPGGCPHWSATLPSTSATTRQPRSTSAPPPGWAAAVLVQARGEAARGRHSDAAALAHDVLDTIAAPALRETLRVRLRDLDRDLFTAASPDRETHELRERLRTLPPLGPVGRASGEPNGR
ncbi:MAG: hypothetical protein ACT4NY_34320 [Pseudonocardiales bacterium]